MSTENTRTDVAVFIDFENVYVSVREKLDASPDFESIMDRCNDLGRVVIARAYADWYRYPRITSALYANGIEPMYVPTYYYDKEMGRTGRAIKNSVDMNLCIDVMKTLFLNTNIGKFVLATGDRDFIPLVNSVRQQGKEVIIIGIGGAASTHLAQSADEFVFYEQLIGKFVETPASRKSKRSSSGVSSGLSSVGKVEPVQAELDIYDTLVEAIHIVRERGYLSTLGSLKLVMKELMGGEFKESRYKDLQGRNFTKFKDFVIDAEKRGKVQIYTNGTVSEVFLPGEDASKLSQFADVIKDVSPPGSDFSYDSPGNQERVAEPLSPSSSSSSSSSSSRSRRRRRPRGQRQESLPPIAAASNDTFLDSDTLSAIGSSEESIDAKNGLDGSLDLGYYASVDEEHEDIRQEISRDEYEDDGQDIDDLYGNDAIFGLDDDEPVHDPSVFQEELGHGLFPGSVSNIQDDAYINRQLPDLGNESSLLFNVGEALTLSHMDVIPGQKVFSWDDIHKFDDRAKAEPEQSEGASAFDVSGTESEESDQSDMIRDEDLVDGQDDTESSSLIDMADAVGANGSESIDFTEDEWQSFRAMMQGFTKPVSFAYIFDALRELRKEQVIVRTNEQLRNLVKQAINNGVLERSGRGKRVYYTIKAKVNNHKEQKTGLVGKTELVGEYEAEPASEAELVGTGEFASEVESEPVSAGETVPIGDVEPVSAGETVPIGDVEPVSAGETVPIDETDAVGEVEFVGEAEAELVSEAETEPVGKVDLVSETKDDDSNQDLWYSYS